MSVQSIQSTDMPKSRDCSVGGAAAFGILAGNTAHDLLPLQRSEMPTKADIRKITNYAYTDAYIKMSRDLSKMNTQTPARDVFVKMFEFGDYKKNYSKAIKKLEGQPDALTELKNLMWLTNKEGSSIAHKMLNQEVKTKKFSRPTLPFIIVGGIATTLAALVYNLTRAILTTED